MILYFDCYITDIPLGKPKIPKDDFRNKSKIYALPTRLAISKYSLASYSVYPWSNVLIKYQIDDPAERAEFEAYAKQLFPKAVIINNRSATQAEYKKSLALLDGMTDNWVFYTPNNDHPLLLTGPEQISFFDRLLKKADKWHQTYKYVAISYSHFSEYITAFKKGSLNFEHFSKGFSILEEDQDAIVALEPKGEFNSLVVVSKDLLRQWFSSVDLGERRVIRAEDVANAVTVENEVMIVPKFQLGAHFESYEHALGGMVEIRVDQVPSLFIPPGFFENKIRIAYGYEENRPGWVNINPAAKYYSFQNLKYGTDLKIGLEDIPIFWKSHIQEMDINKNADKEKLTKGRQKNLDIMYYPWSLKNQGLNLKTFRFWFKRGVLKLYPWFQNVGLLPAATKLKKLFGFY